MEKEHFKSITFSHIDSELLFSYSFYRLKLAYFFPVIKVQIIL